MPTGRHRWAFEPYPNKGIRSSVGRAHSGNVRFWIAMRRFSHAAGHVRVETEAVALVVEQRGCRAVDDQDRSHESGDRSPWQPYVQSVYGLSILLNNCHIYCFESGIAK